MLNLEDLKWSPCWMSDLSHSGYAKYDGTTIKEVLNEIREYAKDKECYYIGDGFGNPNFTGKWGDWRIQINGKIYWANKKENIADSLCKKYDKSMNDLIVERVYMDGLDYRWYYFDIWTTKEWLENE